MLALDYDPPLIAIKYQEELETMWLVEFQTIDQTTKQAASMWTKTAKQPPPYYSFTFLAINYAIK